MVVIVLLRLRGSVAWRPMPHAASPLPALDALLREPEGAVLVERFGRREVTQALRETLAARRAARAFGDPPAVLLDEAADRLARRAVASQRPVFNLTGTVLHTNLGRAPLPPEAAEAAAAALRSATTLEFDLETGRRGERDDHVAPLLCALTGAEAATVVNNNAAAVLLVLNTFALGREVPVSRGELIEIGGSFRIPDIMARAGAVLREVGTTNRTHAARLPGGDRAADRGADAGASVELRDHRLHRGGPHPGAGRRSPAPPACR